MLTPNERFFADLERRETRFTERDFDDLIERLSADLDQAAAATADKARSVAEYGNIPSRVNNALDVWNLVQGLAREVIQVVGNIPGIGLAFQAADLARNLTIGKLVTNQFMHDLGQKIHATLQRYTDELMRSTMWLGSTVVAGMLPVGTLLVNCPDKMKKTTLGPGVHERLPQWLACGLEFPARPWKFVSVGDKLATLNQANVDLRGGARVVRERLTAALLEQSVVSNPSGHVSQFLRGRREQQQREHAAGARDLAETIQRIEAETGDAWSPAAYIGLNFPTKRS